MDAGKDRQIGTRFGGKLRAENIATETGLRWKRACQGPTFSFKRLLQKGQRPRTNNGVDVPLDLHLMNHTRVMSPSNTTRPQKI